MSESDLHPIAVIEDRYTGVYSGGSWLALAKADELLDDASTRAQFCLTDDFGPAGGDLEAGQFWRDPPRWIASGSTPEKALEALRRKLGLAG